MLAGHAEWSGVCAMLAIPWFLICDPHTHLTVLAIFDLELV